jgi:tripartite ATP-independent transporter DctM subunit
VTWLYAPALIAMFGTGLPIAIALLLCGAIGVLVAGVPIGIVAQRMVFGLDSFTLIAIPLFLLMGNLMNASGVTRRIYGFAIAMVGHWRGGLCQVNIFGSVVFSGMSGSALADAAGMGAVEIRAMVAAGYRPSYAAAMSAVSATLGPVIPPSIAAVLYAFIADVSVGRMFLAGIVPGLMMAAVMMTIVHVKAGAADFPRHARVSWPARGRATVAALPALLAPVLLVGGMRSGIFTPTEVAAVGVLYAVVLGLIYWRETDPRALLEACRDTALTTGAIMLIVAAAHVFAWILARDRIPQQLTEAIVTIGLEPWQLLLLINVLLLLLGMVLDTTGIMILVTPVIVPTIVSLGIDPVHFGTVMIVNMMIGLLTPPIGMALFVVSNLAKVPVESVARECVPFIIGLAGVLLVITYVPATVLWLPDLVYGPSR